MIFRLLFLLSITLGFAACSNIDFQDGEFLSNFGAERNNVVLASEPQNGLDEFGKFATAPPYTVEDSEAFLAQSNNDECPYDPTQSPRKMRSKRESRVCDPSTHNSVLGSGHDPSKKDPQEDRGNNKKDSQEIAQPNRDSQESDCAAMPSAPSPVCAVVSEYYIRLHIVYPMTGLLSGWWQLLYARTAPPACYREVGEIFFCCAIVYHNVHNNLRYPILRAQWPLTAVNCIPMENMNLPSEEPQL